MKHKNYIKYIAVTIIGVAITLLILFAGIILLYENTSASNSQYEVSRDFNMRHIGTVVDRETGVNYIIVRTLNKYDGGICIIPRYNPDGTFYITTDE